jgi:nucleoside-diphosphate-sugar epimerase
MADRIAVTGANGFVGRHLTTVASSRRWEVAGVVRSDRGEALVREAGGRPYRVTGLDAAALRPAFEGARAVVHLAGISAERGAATYDSVNLAGMRQVVAAAHAAAVPRIIFFSGLGVARYGQAPRSTNRYFLGKLTCEVELFRSGLQAVALRPSYIIGPGSELIPELLGEMAAGEVERVGDGAYRLQPVAVKDVAELVLACAERTLARPLVVDLVGPEPLSYAAFIDRVAAAAARLGLPSKHRIREVPIAEADRQAAAGGYRGLLPDELDVLFCDEVADPRGIEAALGRFLTPLDEAIEAAIRGSRLGTPLAPPGA